ncbi:NAD(P)-dependent oxidoreductase [Marinilactibacillus sp. XAAS-LB27]|uniref:NAD-dependent epimerase/dehydratase family protein n=1 Tax=Marinilactibacillus sp. XAAS-LB27 TaxID=3114538 RepID=UPI002E181423|nr:NAD(P)-dependent oxidoreductase [Marinilactibacillus sp. XAAS-LB27]
MSEQVQKQTLMLTGATGQIGKVLTPHLADTYHLVVVDKDLSELDKDLSNKVKKVECNLSDPKQTKDLLKDIDYVVHLAGDPRPDADFYDSLLDANFKVTFNLFKEAVETKSVERVIFASSIHAVGGYPLDTQVNVDMIPRPADLYGVSKVYAEVLASHFAFKHQKTFIGIRIGGFDGIEGESETLENLIKYLSPRDMCHLVDRCLNASLKKPFLLVNGVSDNTYKRLDIQEARETIQYEPQDNAFEQYGLFEKITDNIGNIK